MLYSDFQKDPVKMEKIYQAYNGTEERKRELDAAKYYEGNNVGISEVKKQMVLKNEEGNFYAKENPFLSNFKIADNEFQTIVDQKVDSLFFQDPKFEGLEKEKIKTLIGPISYALFEMATQASIFGNSYCFIDVSDTSNPQFKVFENEQCVPFYNDKTGTLQGLIRTWSQTNFEGKTTQYMELYDIEEYCLYIKEGKNEWSLKEETVYKFLIKGNDYQQEIVPDEGWKFPVVEMINNKKKSSDLTNSIRGIIDIIDVILSDWANNLSDFQESFLVIKGMDPSMDLSDASKFLETLKSTYQAMLPEGAEIDALKNEIPFEAKKEFLSQLNSKLIKSAGMPDSEMIMQGQMTNVALKMAYDKLVKKVSRFEYFANEAGMELLKKVKIALNDTTAEIPSIEFRKGFVNNDTEIIQNLAMSAGMISNKTRVEKHPYVDNPEEELQRLDEESMSMFGTEPTAPGGDGNGDE